MDLGLVSIHFTMIDFQQYVVDMLKPRVVEMTWENKTENEPITAPKLRDMALRNYCKWVFVSIT
jgi:hypothetical protein